MKIFEKNAKICVFIDCTIFMLDAWFQFINKHGGDNSCVIYVHIINTLLASTQIKSLKQYLAMR